LLKQQVWIIIQINYQLIKKQRLDRASAYTQLSTMFGSEEAADYFDANGFITGDGKDVERIHKNA
jgi:hypothetical protein